MKLIRAFHYAFRVETPSNLIVFTVYFNSFRSPNSPLCVDAVNLVFIEAGADLSDDVAREEGRIDHALIRADGLISDDCVGEEVRIYRDIIFGFEAVVGGCGRGL